MRFGSVAKQTLYMAFAGMRLNKPLYGGGEMRANGAGAA